MKGWRFAGMALILLVFCSAGLYSQEKNTPSPQDKAIRQKIVESLMLDEWLQGYMPQLSVESGVATLTGKIKSDVQRKRVIAAVSRVQGVKKVIDKLELVKP